MDDLEIAKIQNTINEIQNLLNKDSLDPSHNRVFMMRACNQLNQLLTHIGYLQSKKINISFDEWLKIGIENYWCGPPVCEIHDGLPMTLEEEDQFFEGNDPCIHIIRLYEDQSIALQVEENHSPSNWRKPYELRKH